MKARNMLLFVAATAMMIPAQVFADHLFPAPPGPIGAGFGVDITDPLTDTEGTGGAVSPGDMGIEPTFVSGTWNAGDIIRFTLAGSSVTLAHGSINGLVQPTFFRHTLTGGAVPASWITALSGPPGPLTVRFDVIAGSLDLDGLNIGWANNLEIDGVASTVGPINAAAAVPEPSTLLLLGTGLVGLVGYGRRKRKA